MPDLRRGGRQVARAVAESRSHRGVQAGLPDLATKHPSKRSNGCDQATWEPSYRPGEGDLSKESGVRKELRDPLKTPALILQSLNRIS